MTDIRLAATADARAIAEVKIETWRATYGGIVPQTVLDAMDVNEHSRYWARAALARTQAHSSLSKPARSWASLPPGHASTTRDRRAIRHLRAAVSLEHRRRARADASRRRLAFGTLAEAVLWVAEENPRARRFYERYGWVAETNTRRRGRSRRRYQRGALPPLRPRPSLVWHRDSALLTAGHGQGLVGGAQARAVARGRARGARRMGRARRRACGRRGGDAREAAPPSPEHVAEIERRTGHDLAAFVDAVGREPRH